MSPTQEVACPETQKKYEQILQENGITDTVSHVIVKDAGLKGLTFILIFLYFKAI